MVSSEKEARWSFSCQNRCLGRFPMFLPDCKKPQRPLNARLERKLAWFHFISCRKKIGHSCAHILWRVLSKRRLVFERNAPATRLPFITPDIHYLFSLYIFALFWTMPERNHFFSRITSLSFSGEAFLVEHIFFCKSKSRKLVEKFVWVENFQWWSYSGGWCSATPRRLSTLHWYDKQGCQYTTTHQNISQFSKRNLAPREVRCLILLKLPFLFASISSSCPWNPK